MKITPEKYAESARKHGITQGPWVVGSGSHVCGMWSGMIRVESPEDFHNNGEDYGDGGSTRSYTNVVCGTTGHSDTATAHIKAIASLPDLLIERDQLMLACGRVMDLPEQMSGVHLGMTQKELAFYRIGYKEATQNAKATVKNTLQGGVK